MLSKEQPGDASSDASATDLTAETPLSDPTVIDDDDVWAGRCIAVPWPGNTYMVIERGSSRAITLTDDGLCLQSISDDRNANNCWRCVESNGYFAFYNAKAGVYLGHNSQETMRASATSVKEWELMVPRRHPDGGYQLLMPHWLHTMMILTAVEGGRKLMRTQHGETRWEFVKV